MTLKYKYLVFFSLYSHCLSIHLQIVNTIQRDVSRGAKKKNNELKILSILSTVNFFSF